ncbi:hypothetical protein ACJMK2_035515, partial [Sinanodonta woodiana]
YIAIMHPLRPRMQSNKVLVIILIIWAISIALAFPNFIYAKAPSIGMRTICILAWTDGFSETTDLAYSILITIVNYAFPMVTLAVAYTRIGFELWGSKAIGEDTPVQVERIKSKRKVVKMMIVVVVIFGICWLPQHLYFLLVHIVPSIPYMAYTQQLYLVIFWLAMSNSMYNPMIYCWMNSKFREGFIRVFCWCSCRPCKNVRSRLRFRRTLFPAGVTTMSEKYSDRNGSLMTMTEYVDETTASILRSSSKHRNKKEKHSNSYSDYV